MQVGGIILAGGRSRRMGVSKATLQFGPEVLLQRIVQIVGEAVSPVVVVAAPDQDLPTLNADVIVVRDRHPDRGPLEGIAAGLRALAKTDAAYVSACDTPLLTPDFIRRVITLLDDNHQAAVPLVGEMPQPLSGIYSTDILPHVDRMLREDNLKLLNLLSQLSVRWVMPEEFADVDPNLDSLRNLNTPADYHAALAAAGLAGENR